MASRTGASRGGATQRRQQQQHEDEVNERLTKLEATIASIYSKDDVKQVVKEVLGQEISTLRRDLLQQLANRSVPVSKNTGRTAGYKNADELRDDKRVQLLVNG
jgi:DNA-binding ferritin-like protein